MHRNHHKLGAGLLLVLCLAASPLAEADTQVTLLVDDSYPPYTYQRNGEAAGIYVDILRAAEPLLHGYRLRLRPLPWRRALAEIEAGRELAVVPPYYRPQERPWIAPYSVPMLEERLAVFCRQDIFKDNPRLRWPEDYRGLRFGNNMGFLPGGQPFWSAVQLGLIHVEEAPGNRANLLKLVHQRIDCYLNDRLSVLSELAGMRDDGLYEPSKHGLIAEGPSVSVENGHVGFSNRTAERFPFKQDFADQLDSALIQLRQSGEIERIVQRYIQ
ncbi:ABC transporter substrate-binding protein [Pseudomonas sp.]|uniref:substrate-binding periplasmic protein n=1 Tax=Pseudomonas sp. TaxID=306 RepID=UPI0027367B5B|nr:ABC transporter substrate-binding protein [Pseudomonas sp.]MDP3815794.1 ABC transporter substrate-binding protein [Pseudomonas sp.]